jgi:hypothetical protein
MKKSLFSLVLFGFLSAFSLVSAQETSPVEPSDRVGGSGGSVSNLAELRWLSEHSEAWNESWVLTADIDASETNTWNLNAGNALGFSPIGSSTIKFDGSFNGQGHVIRNLYINRPVSDYVGLFGYANTDSKIDSLGLEDVEISGKTYVGGLFGYGNNAIVNNAHISGSVSGASYTGGLAGRTSYGDISNSYFSGIVSGSAYMGGFVGYVNSPRYQESGYICIHQITYLLELSIQY